MQLARFLNKVFKKDGFILTDANSKDYIIGNPSKNPIKLCKEWIYKDNDAIREVFVNSFSKLEFLDIIKPYIDQHFETEGHM